MEVPVKTKIQIKSEIRIFFVMAETKIVGLDIDFFY